MASIANKNIPAFLSTFLSRPASALPKGAQWVVAFEDLKGRILPGIQLAYSYEPRAAEWQTQKASEAILTDSYQSSRGCLFCQAIALPGEGTTAVVEGNIKSNAFLRSYVGAGREDFPQMRMTFLETNVSFADNFLRGWALSTSNFGMLARAKNDQKNYRTNLICYKIGTIAPDLPPFILMTMSFYDICCISVSEEEYNYAPATAPVMREARFIFNHYAVNTTTGNSDSLLSNNPSLTRRATQPTYINPADVQARNASIIENRMAQQAADLTGPVPEGGVFQLNPATDLTVEQQLEIIRENQQSPWNQYINTQETMAGSLQPNPSSINDTNRAIKAAVQSGKQAVVSQTNQTNQGSSHATTTNNAVEQAKQFNSPGDQNFSTRVLQEISNPTPIPKTATSQVPETTKQMVESSKRANNNKQ